MDLKKILKFIKVNEMALSYVLGVLILILSAVFVARYIKNLSSQPSINNGTSTQTQNVTHVVTKGETLWSISSQYYKEGSSWKTIAEANNITDPAKLEVGQSLTIPDITVPSPSASTTQAPTESPKPQISEEGASSVNEIKESTYTVVKGDCLWNIALRAYGDGEKWHEIAEANKLANPRIIHSGNVFTIPR